MNAIILAAALLAAPATPEQAVATLWRALSHEAGQPGDETALRAILHPDAMVYGARYRDGAAALSVARGSDFAAGIGRVGGKGFHECEVAREVRQYDRFAAVYSVVESRTERAAPKADFTVSTASSCTVPTTAGASSPCTTRSNGPASRSLYQAARPAPAWRADERKNRPRHHAGQGDRGSRPAKGSAVRRRPQVRQSHGARTGALAGG
jgi:hypothetical protein